MPFPKLVTFVFPGFNLIFDTFHQLFNWSRYGCNILFVTMKSFPAAQIAISFANLDQNINLWLSCGISLTYRMSSIGLKGLPWGTPWIWYNTSLRTLLSFIVSPLSYKEPFIHCIRFISNLKSYNLESSPLCHTWSKAFCTSKNPTVEVMLLLKFCLT